MTEEIINADGSRNWEANILLDNIKRLEQENRELKEKFEQYKKSKQKSYETLQKRLNDIEWENKELKKFFDSAAKKNTSLENKIKEYHERYDELYWTTDQLVKDKTKLKQTLEEINKIAEPRFVNGLNEKADLCNLAMNRIQNKINEVLK